MTTEQVIDQILSDNPGVSKEEITEKLKKQKLKTSGLISDETLLRMVAAELGVKIQNDHVPPPILSLTDLVPSLNDVTVVGRVVAIFPPKAFSGKKSGKFASFLISDKSGILRVVLWNDRTSLIESGQVKAGQIIQVSHGYTKEDRDGKVELHAGDKCEIEVNLQNVEPKEYPTIGKFTTKIVQVTHACKNRKINVAGTVRKLLSVSTFERQDASLGKVMRFTLADETGEKTVVAWNEKVDELEKALKEGVGLQLINAKIKKATGEDLEIHVDAGTYVETLPDSEGFLKVADLKEHLTSVNVEGEVATKPMLREVKTSKQEPVQIASFELKDETGRIWVSAWRRHALAASRLRAGDKIAMKNAYVRRGFSDQLEISTRDATSMTVIQ
jgi:replication factor A1